MYDPNEARKSYLDLFRDNALKAAGKAIILVVVFYFYQKFLQQEITPFSITFVFCFFCIYFTWKPKVIRFVRGWLRGSEFRDKVD